MQRIRSSLTKILNSKYSLVSKIIAGIVILGVVGIGYYTLSGSHADNNNGLTNTSDVTTFGASSSTASSTTITSGALSSSSQISPYDYGVNQVWYDNGYGSTNPVTQQAYPDLVNDVKSIGINIVRYPGGNPSDLFHWEDAIGPQASRQPTVIDGTSYQADAAVPSSYGPDEFGTFLDQTGAAGDITVNFDTGSSTEAADWVCYMTSPLNNTHDPACNAWAAKRAANGHATPYNIPYWEVGNEPNVGQYWRSGTVVSSPGNCKTGQYACLYAYGGVTKFTNQKVQVLPTQTSSSQITQNNYYVADPPVVANSATVTVQTSGTGANSADLSAPSVWTDVSPTDLANSKLGAHEYTIDPVTGKITFHMIQNSAMLPGTPKITISYESGDHEGFNQFYSAMKTADPSAKVCATYPTSTFMQAEGSKYPYDCLVIHDYGLADGSSASNYTPDEFHDQAMLSALNATQSLNTKNQNFQASIKQYAGNNAKNVQLVITEYGILNYESPATGDLESSSGSFPLESDYHRSQDLAVFSADMLKDILDDGIAMAEKHYLTSYNFSTAPGLQAGFDSHAFSGNAIIDTSSPTCTATTCTAPTYVMQPTALVMEEYSTLLYKNLISSTVANNPNVTVPSNVAGDTNALSGTYPELSTVATTDGKGNEAILVINNTPNTYVQSKIKPSDATDNNVNAWTLAASGTDSFLAYNTPAQPNNVALRTSTSTFSNGELAASFPPSSVTVLRFSKVATAPTGPTGPTAPGTVTPTVPTGLHATHATNNSVTIAWNASTDSKGTIGGYNIDENGNHLATTATTPTSYTITGLTAGTTYFFSVSAYNTNGQTSIPAPRIQVATTASNTGPTTVTPTIPTNLRVTATTNTSVTIAWTSSTDSVGTINGYNIIENANHLTTTPATATSYTITGLTPNTSYYFSVASYNTTGQTSIPAPRVQATTK